ncbi:MAG: flaN [Caulobacteraceae bacterium]|nr:flaN [Caulobacteraceae bacterium]
MTLSVSLKTATSGLLAAQTGLRAVSDNIANVNTPGYVRKTVLQRPQVVNGVGMGVEITGVKRVTDQYLQLASLAAGSDASRWDVVSQYLDNAQALFGDPSSQSFFFNRLDDVYAAFATSADDPSSSLLRNQALSTVQDFLGESSRINEQIDQLGSTVDAQLVSNVDRANDLLGQINRLNNDISRAQLIEQDASGSENIQTVLIDELATLMAVKVIPRAEGGVTIRSAEGIKLAGDGAATLTFNRTDSTRGYISATPSDGGAAQPIQFDGGEIRGLLDLRNETLPALSDQLGEFVSRAVEQLNAAHNASTGVPAPSTMTGRNTGLDLTTAIGGFTGANTLAIVDSAGVVQRRIDVDFTAGTMSVDGGPAAGFTPASFLADVNTALGGMGTASFTNGALSISTAGGGGIAFDEGTSMNSGRAFSHFFGLNDLVKSQGFTSYETGLKPTDPHGFVPGDQIVLRLAQPDGAPLRDVTVTVPALANMSDLLASLNNSTTGVGLYGQFALDAGGALAFTGTPPTNAAMSVVQDNTQHGVGGPSMSELFGLSVTERSSRASRFSVSQVLAADPTKLSFAKLDLTVPAGQSAIRPGDGRGALALSNAGDVSTKFQAAGSLGIVNMTVGRYASEFGGSIGRDAAAAETRKQGAASVQSEAVARRQAVEGVNLDEELVRLTTYQQAFNASARMIQAAKDLFDVLVQMV